METKLAVAKTVDLIGKALHPSRLTSPYVLPSRDELVELLLDYISPARKDKAGKARSAGKEKKREKAESSCCRCWDRTPRLSAPSRTSCAPKVREKTTPSL